MSAPQEILANIEQQQPVDIERVIENLSQDLPHIAEQLITDTADMTDPANVTFAEDPDNRKYHAPKWHQYGIITHSREFARAMKETVPTYLEEWGVAEEVNAVLDQEIDGVPKRDLLTVASLLHDVGKFTARKVESENGHTSAHFTDHEEQSGAIIRTSLKPSLTEQGLTDDQVEYVASCAELHFELGKVRRASKEQTDLDFIHKRPVGYTMAFANSPKFEREARNIIGEHPDFAVEIGLQFIADGLSKTEVMAIGTTDEEIASQSKHIVQELTNRHLDIALKSQALQMPVNLEVAKNYLLLCAEQQRLLEAQRLEAAQQLTEEQGRYADYKLGHVATLAARKLLDSDDAGEIHTELRGKDGRYYKFSREIREPSEIAYTYDMFVDGLEYYSAEESWFARKYRDPELRVGLMLEPGETKTVDMFAELVRGWAGSSQSVSEHVGELEKSAPNSLQIIGFKNGMEIVNPFELRDWRKSAGVASPNYILPIKVITEPKEEASKYSYIDQGILNLSDSGEPKVTVEALSATSRNKFFDNERLKYLQELADSWGDSGMYRVRFGNSSKQDYVALVLPRKNDRGEREELVVAENYEYGNAVFVIDPKNLAKGDTWIDILAEKSKDEAKAGGAIKIAHDEGGTWKERVLDLLTTPQS